MRVAGWGVPFPGLVAVAVLLVGCGDRSRSSVGERPSDRPDTAGSAASPPAPFTVSPVPEGLALTAVADGTAEPVWSDDSIGGVNPTLFLVPTDWGGVADRRWIEVSSIDGTNNQGGLYQGLPYYPGPPGKAGERFTLGGHPAVRQTQRDGIGDARRTAAFVAVNTTAGPDDDFDGGQQQALLVTGTIDELELFERVAASATVGPDRTPAIDDVPTGWRVLGSLTGHQAVGPNDFALFDEQLPVGRRVLQFGTGGSGEIRVTTLEGDELTPTLKALEASWWQSDAASFETTQRVPHDRGDAWMLVCCDPVVGGGAQQASAWLSIDGAPFEIRGPASRLGTPELLAEFAATIRLVSEADWTAAKSAAPPPTSPPTFDLSTTTMVVPATASIGN